MKRPLLLLPLLALAAAPCLAEMRNGILPTRRMESRQLTERECVKSPNGNASNHRIFLTGWHRV